MYACVCVSVCARVPHLVCAALVRAGEGGVVREGPDGEEVDVEPDGAAPVRRVVRCVVHAVEPRAPHRQRPQPEPAPQHPGRIKVCIRGSRVCVRVCEMLHHVCVCVNVTHHVCVCVCEDTLEEDAQFL
jgi:hypothetical protein